MREFAPRLMLVNFWDMDVAHWGSYSLYLQAITKTDRLTGMLWDEVQSQPELSRTKRPCWCCRNWGGMAIRTPRMDF